MKREITSMVAPVFFVYINFVMNAKFYIIFINSVFSAWIYFLNFVYCLNLPFLKLQGYWVLWEVRQNCSEYRFGITVKLIRNDFQVDTALNVVNFHRWWWLYKTTDYGFRLVLQTKLEYTKPVVSQVIMIGGTGLRHFE